jgi:hypothetical protein
MKPGVPTAVPSRVGLHEEVGGFELPVDDAERVGGPEHLQHLDGEVHGAVHGQPPLALEHGLEGFTGHALHGEEEESLVGAKVIHRHRARVVQPGQDPGLALEALHEARSAGDMGVHHLEGDEPVETGLRRLVDTPHAPLAQRAQDPEAPRDHPPRREPHAGTS